MRFLLETENVSSISEGIGRIAKSVADISSSVSGYNVSDADEFNFSGAKSKLASCIDACADRMTNTSSVINSVVSSHTQLQNSYTFENYLNPKKEKEEESSDDTSRERSYSPGAPRRYRNSSRHASIDSFTTPYIPNVIPGIIKENEEKRINSLSYAIVDSKKLAEDSKNMLSSYGKTDELGYTKVGNRYAIACDSSIAKVGDVLKFTSADGKTVECVVAVNTTTDINKDKMFLLVNGNKKVKAVDFSNIITDKNTKIKNLGNYKVVGDFKEPETPKSEVAASAENASAKAVTETTQKIEETAPVQDETANAQEKEEVNTEEVNNNGGVMNA